MTDEINIPDLVRRLADHPRETEWLEFKSSDAEPSELGEYISAIANSVTIAGRDCGYNVWGIHDENHAIIGLYPAKSASAGTGRAPKGNLF